MVLISYNIFIQIKNIYITAESFNEFRLKLIQLERNKHRI